MRDVFYTILVVWIIAKVLNAFSSKGKSNPASNKSTKQGETFIKHSPEKKKTVSNDLGEYVDYEDVK